MASIKKSPGAKNFGRDPDAYELGRPGYPSELFNWLNTECRLSPTTNCFEIGAGTGQATRPLLALGVKSIVAIEPDAALVAHLESYLRSAALHIQNLRFEDANLAPNTFDFGFAATAFHWLPRMKALAQCLEALKSGGYFAMWWNIYHNSSAPDAFDRATEHLFIGLEQGPKKSTALPFALDVNSRLGEMRKAGFADVRHQTFRLNATFSANQISALYGTFSRVQIAPAQTRNNLLGEVVRIANQNFDGAVTREILTSVFVGRKR